MNDREYRDIALGCAREAAALGCHEAEVYLLVSRRVTSFVNAGRVENVTWANPMGLGLRVITDKRQGFVYSSDFRPESLHSLAEKAAFLARKGTPDEANGLPEKVGADVPASELRIHDPRCAEVTQEQAADMALRMEKAAFSFDERIASTDSCRFAASEDLVVLADSRGRCNSYRSTSCALMIEAVARENDGTMQSAVEYASARSIAALESPERVGEEAARKAVSLLGARSIRTQRVPVVLSPEVASGWISDIFYALDGEEALKNTTFLGDKLGHTIGSSLVTLVDDGLMPGGIATSPFDAEGVPTARNVFIERGVCKGFVYNTYSARRAGRASTGNASRGYDSPPGIGTHNLYLEPGSVSREEIIASIERGLYVASTGSFGFNPNTGDYSYEAAGLWIEKGELTSPVHEVTIASNTLEMLAGVEMVGNDLTFKGSVNSPSIKIREMTVSGRQG